MTTLHRIQNEKLREEGYTHTRKKVDNVNRYVYYSLLKKNQDTLEEMENVENVKVYCKDEDRDITDELLDPAFKNKRNSTLKLLNEGYTHVRYKNRKCYNIQTSSYQPIELDDIGKIKVYCNETKSDITDSVCKNIKISKRFNHLKENTSKKRLSTKELRKQNYTHKRYKNRKIYDLNNGKYISEDILSQEVDFKIYDDISKQDITQEYL